VRALTPAELRVIASWCYPHGFITISHDEHDNCCIDADETFTVVSHHNVEEELTFMQIADKYGTETAVLAAVTKLELIPQYLLDLINNEDGSDDDYDFLLRE
jgi:hypothetical protein